MSDLPEAYQTWLFDHRRPVSAAISSVISTFAGFPLDSVKSRLQVKRYDSILDCIKETQREEGIRGFFRGIGIPLLTITIVRTTSFSIYDYTKRSLIDRYDLKDTPINTALLGFAGGATGGILISFGSCAFELAKIRAQLEYLIARRKGVPYEPTGTIRGAVQIFRAKGIRGLYYGFPLHLTRDTLGTGFYFAMYDSMRRMANIHFSKSADSIAPFLCGSSAGILSWMMIYPVDLVKTRVQRDALAEAPRIGAWKIFKKLSSRGIPRLYRGLGISAGRSMLTHGLQWTLLEKISTRIETAYAPSSSLSVSPP